MRSNPALNTERLQAALAGSLRRPVSSTLGAAMAPTTTTLFVSHASEDKTEFVRPLAHALKKRGLKVWYDEFDLKVGDSLRRSIDRGLAECSAGIVVLSPAFFAKEWPQRELDALYSAEVAGRSRLLPVWHGVDAKFVAAISPLLADRLAIPSGDGVEAVADAIAQEFPPPAKYSGAELAELLERCQSSGLFAGEALLAGCHYRFYLLNAFKEEYVQATDAAISKLSDDELENFPSQLERCLEEEHARLRLRHGIPHDVYLTSDEPVRERHLKSFLEDISQWASGTLSRADSERLANDLDHEELDEYFILLGLPNFSFSRRQRDLLEVALVELGCGFEDGYKSVERVCKQLRSLDGGA